MPEMDNIAPLPIPPSIAPVAIKVETGNMNQYIVKSITLF